MVVVDYDDRTEYFLAPVTAATTRMNPNPKTLTTTATNIVNMVGMKLPTISTTSHRPRKAEYISTGLATTSVNQLSATTSLNQQLSGAEQNTPTCLSKTSVNQLSGAEYNTPTSLATTPSTSFNQLSGAEHNTPTGLAKHQSIS